MMCGNLRTVDARRACFKRASQNVTHHATLHVIGKASAAASMVDLPDNTCIGFEHVKGSWIGQKGRAEAIHLPRCCNASDRSRWCQRAPLTSTGAADEILPIKGKGCAVARCSGWIEQYAWRPDSCALVPWSAQSFCTVLGRRRMLFIGDSTMNQVAAAIAHAVRWGFDFARAQSASSSSAPSCAAQIQVGLSDTLVGRMGAFGAKNRGHAWEQLVNRYRLKTSGMDADIVLLSAGAHVYGNDNFTLVLEHVAQTRERLFPLLPLIWTSGPSAGCGRTPLPAAPDTAFWSSYNASAVVFSNWKDFVARDTIARDFWRVRGGPLASVLDVSPLHRRVDAHPGPPTIDCLHMCEPALTGLLPTLLHHHLQVSELLGRRTG